MSVTEPVGESLYAAQKKVYVREVSTVAQGLNTAAGWLLLAFGALMMLGPFRHAHH